jgi:hypothetical protein
MAEQKQRPFITEKVNRFLEFACRCKIALIDDNAMIEMHNVDARVDLCFYNPLDPTNSLTHDCKVITKGQKIPLVQFDGLTGRMYMTVDSIRYVCVMAPIRIDPDVDTVTSRKDLLSHADFSIRHLHHVSIHTPALDISVLSHLIEDKCQPQKTVATLNGISYPCVQYDNATLIQPIMHTSDNNDKATVLFYPDSQIIEVIGNPHDLGKATDQTFHIEHIDTRKSYKRFTGKLYEMYYLPINQVQNLIFDF